MKKIVLSSKASLLAIVLLFGVSSSSFASTFTASTSGNWSSSTTWGEAGPGFNITGDNTIVILSGVIVTLDSNLTINNVATSLTVTGSLTGSTTNMIITAGTLTGSGMVTINDLTVGASGWVTSSGTIAVSQLSNSQAALALGGIVNVSSTIVLNPGVVQLNTGGVVNLANNATINMAGGSYSITGGLFNLGAAYNLLYTGAVSVVGPESLLAGLQNVTVNLASSANQLTLSASLIVTGVLSLQQGVLNLNGNTLTINGGINTAATGSIAGSATSNVVVNGTGSVGTIAFASGSQTLDNLTLTIGANGSILLASDVTVDGVLTLTGSSLSLNGYNLTIGGTLVATVAGSIIGNSNSNLTVSGTGLAGTLMFSSSGNTIGNLTVDISSAGSVLLGSDLIVSGTLTLSNGSLNLNGQNITIDGTIDATGSGSISGNILSNITFNGSGGEGDLVLTTGSQTINNLTINIASSGSVTLGSNLTVVGTLTLAQGNVSIGTSNLTIASTGSIQGGSSASYVITGDTGRLIMTVANAGANGIFEVGTAANYAPVTVTNNSTLAGSFNVLAHSGVFSSGTTGYDLSVDQSVVNTSWDVSSSLITGAKVDLEMFWNTAMQVNGFDDAQAYISHYTGGAWNTNALAAATSHAGGTYSLALTGVTSFSPFAVFDKNTSTGVQNVQAPANASFNIYPNPVADILQIMVQNPGKNPILKIFDAIGNEIVSQAVENSVTSLDISSLAPGVYLVSLNNVMTKKFIKE